ncbi:MAG: hypothetical protein WCP39_07730, partial [Chlamydiota bacterium]
DTLVAPRCFSFGGHGRRCNAHRLLAALNRYKQFLDQAKKLGIIFFKHKCLIIEKEKKEHF